MVANKDIKRAHLEEMIAETNLRIQKGDRYPVIDLFGQYSYLEQKNEVGFLMSNKSFGPQVGVTVRFNLFNGGNESREIRNTQILKENSKLAKKSTMLDIESAVYDRYYQYQSLSQQLAIARENIKAATASLEIARRQLQTGDINGYDFRLTQLSVLSAQNVETELKFAMKVLEVEINRISGQLLGQYLQ